LDKITKSLLSEFATESGISKLSEDKQFEHFSSYLAIGRMLAETFDTAETVIGGGADTGIDAIGVIINGSLIDDAKSVQEYADRNGFIDATFVFIQAERSSGFDTTKIGQFTFGVLDYFADTPALPRNKDINRFVKMMNAVYSLSGLFKRGNPSCRLYYVTTGTWVGDKALEARKNAAVEGLKALRIFRNVEFIPVGADGIQRLYRESKNSISREFEFAQKTVIPEIDGVTEAYLGLLPASQFLHLIKDDDGELLKSIFYDNVRDWQEFNPVNTEIKDTLETKGTRGRFALMNNGITIIAKTLRATGNKFYIEDYQVVNGCQTSHVLYDQRNTISDEVMIPLRLISTKNDEIISSIIKATNRQTEVREEQLLALSDFQKKLESYFTSYEDTRRLFYERRSKQYNSTGGIEKTRIITPGMLIRSFASMFLEEPHRATRSYKRILDRVGVDIFAANDRLEPYYVAALAAYRLEYLFRNQFLDNSLRSARFEIMLALRYVLFPVKKLPKMNSRELERACLNVIDILWDPAKSEDAFHKALELVLAAAEQDLESAPLRTESFTESLTNLASSTVSRKSEKKKK